MSDEVIGWTIETLRAHLTALMESDNLRYDQAIDNQKLAVKDALAAQKEQTNAAFASSEKAIGKAEDAQKEYNARSNEFRGQLDDQAKMLMPRVEAVNRLETIVQSISRQSDINEKLSNRITAIESSSVGMKAMWGYIVGAIGLLAMIAGFILKK